jgi:hypothetical protein
VTPLPRSEYISVTTYRRTGVPVPTPPADHPEARAALRRAYGLGFTLGDTTSRLWQRALRRPGERHELIRIRPV